jgi:hypothetical protein
VEANSKVETDSKAGANSKLAVEHNYDLDFDKVVLGFLRSSTVRKVHSAWSSHFENEKV